MVRTVVVVGGGIAALSTAEEIRRRGDKSSRIVLLTTEEFCSRPTLFFRLKFSDRPSVEFGRKKTSYYERKGIELKQEGVKEVNREQKYVVLDNEEEVSYDVLVFCTGGLPQVPPVPVAVSAEQTRSHSHLPPFRMSKYVEVLPEMEEMPKGVMVVRNPEESTLLNECVRAQLKTVIVGAGALCLDLVSNICEGYDLENGQRTLDITIVCRQNRLGSSFLDEEASSIIAQRLAKYPGIQVLYEDEVSRILCVENGEDRYVENVETKKGSVLECDVLVFATGVRARTDLAKSCGLACNEGILVDRNFRTVEDENVFAAGDCAEVLDDPKSVGCGELMRSVWKNWTSAREVCALERLFMSRAELTRMQEGQACARAILEAEVPRVIFNQNLLLFHLHVCCLGYYLPNDKVWKEEPSRYQIETRRDFPYMYYKLILRKTEDGVVLVGALLVGEEKQVFETALKITKFLQKLVLQKNWAPLQLTSDSFTWKEQEGDEVLQLDHITKLN